MTIRVARFEELTVQELHDLLRLRVDVFVVEQACAYAEVDGRDPESTHYWIENDQGGPRAALRVIDEGDVRRIGRVATVEAARGRGHAGCLIDRVLATTEGPWVLDAQAHLAEWYGSFGFGVVGAEYLEDGIPHVPMRREP